MFGWSKLTRETRPTGWNTRKATYSLLTTVQIHDNDDDKEGDDDDDDDCNTMFTIYYFLFRTHLVSHLQIAS